MSLEEIIKQLLSTTLDPFLKQTALDMRIKYTLSTSDQTCSLNLTAGFPTHLLQQTFLPQLHTMLQHACPNHHIDITLQPFIKAHRTQLAGKGLRGVRNTIAIASGKV